MDSRLDSIDKTQKKQLKKELKAERKLVEKWFEKIKYKFPLAYYWGLCECYESLYDLNRLAAFKYSPESEKLKKLYDELSISVIDENLSV